MLSISAPAPITLSALLSIGLTYPYALQKAVEWQKKFESAHCKACSAASMAAEKENELQAFDEKVVEMLLGIKEDR